MLTNIQLIKLNQAHKRFNASLRNKFKDMITDPYLIEQYRELHSKNEGYGNAATYSKRIGEWAIKLGCISAIDYGCGKGKLADVLFKRFGIPTIKYDPAIPDYSNHPDFKVDLVVCMDVLEHLTEETLVPVLQEINFLAIKGIFMNISCRPAVHKLPDGQQCHTIVQNQDWWLCKLEDIMGEFQHEYGESNKNLIVWQDRS